MQRVELLLLVILILELFQHLGALLIVLRLVIQLFLVVAPGFFPLQLTRKLLHIAPQAEDVLDELYVGVHDVQVLLLVDLTLRLKPLLQRVQGVLEVPLLVVVLLLYFWVVVLFLCLLVLDVLAEVGPHSFLQGLLGVNMWHYSVDCVLEAVYVHVVVADLVSVPLDDLLHRFLPSA